MLNMRAFLLTAIAYMLLAASSAVFAEDIYAIVDRANDYVATENYQQAIQLYEQAIQLAPEEPKLKSNLSVLYFNYAIQLQNRQQYDESAKILERLIAESTDTTAVTKAKKALAGNHYYQANGLRQVEPVEGQEKDYNLMREHMKKAIELDPTEQAFKNTMASLFLEEAHDYAIKKDFPSAIPLLEEAQTYNANSEAIKQSLANVYLAMAQDNPEEKEAWIEKAKAADSSPMIAQKADMILEGHVATQAGPTNHEFLGETSTNPLANSPVDKLASPTLPPGAQKLSASEMVRDIEKQLGIEPKKKETLINRLSYAEEQVYGEFQEGPINTRVKELYAELFGGRAPVSMPATRDFVQDPVETSEFAYLDEIFKFTDGQVIRWGKFPLRVYIDEPEEEIGYQSTYREFVIEGLETWKEATGDFTDYTIVKSPTAADVQVLWSDEAVEDKYIDAETGAVNYQDLKMPKSRKNVLRALQVASMLTPGYFGLAPQLAGAALQYQQMKKLQVLVDESKIYVPMPELLDKTPEEAQIYVHNLTAREFGHVLGLKGYSSNPDDLISPTLPLTEKKTPSDRDLETLRQLYNRPANIILNIK